VPRLDADRWWQLTGRQLTGGGPTVNQPPHTHPEDGEESKPGFDLEQLPTTHTNKWAIFRQQEEGLGAHHGNIRHFWLRPTRGEASGQQIT